MHLITFATIAEAEATLTTFQAKEVETNFYSSTLGNILITGMGPEKTHASVLRYIDKADHFINFGIAGALREDVNSTTFLHQISQVTDENTLECISLLATGFHLLTVDEPLYDTKKRDRFAQHHHLVDMEGYVIAKLAKSNKKRCSIYKIVSDFCNENTHEEIMKKLSIHSYTLAQEIKKIL